LPRQPGQASGYQDKPTQLPVRHMSVIGLTGISKRI
jgi:hypothetical protein